MTRFLASVLAAAALLLAAAPATAQTTSGTISGTLGLDDVTWYVTGAGSKSFWQRKEDGLVVRLVGHPNREKPAGMQDAVTLRFTTKGGPESARVHTASLRYHREEGQDRLAEGENVIVELTSLEVTGNDLTVVGTVTGRLTKGGASGRNLSDAGTLTMDADFQATLTRHGTGGS